MVQKIFTKEQMFENIYDDLAQPILEYLTSKSSCVLSAILYGGYTKQEAVELVDEVARKVHQEYEQYKQAEYKYLGNSKGEK